MVFSSKITSLSRLCLTLTCVRIHVATVNEDYLPVDINVTFTSGQNASGDNQQCFSVPILNDDLLECNETFDIVLSPIAEYDDVVNVTGQVITVTIEEDPSDCMLKLAVTKYKCLV